MSAAISWRDRSIIYILTPTGLIGGAGPLAEAWLKKAQAQAVTHGKASPLGRAVGNATNPRGESSPISLGCLRSRVHKLTQQRRGC